jgi:hypothetical protein
MANVCTCVYTHTEIRFSIANTGSSSKDPEVHVQQNEICKTVIRRELIKRTSDGSKRVRS